MAELMVFQGFHHGDYHFDRSSDYYCHDHKVNHYYTKYYINGRVEERLG